MSHSSRVSLALAAVVVAAALSAGPASAQGNSNAVNSLPSPYQPVDGFFKLPEGRKIGSTAGIHVDRDGSSIWVFDRCGGQGCVGSNLAPIQKFDASGKLVYHGTVDDSPKDAAAVKSDWLRDAVNAVSEGKAVAEPETKSMGCSIKYREKKAI